MKQVKGLLGMEEPAEEKTFSQQFDEYCGLTRTQRMYGFGITFAVGWILTLMGVIAVPQIATHPEKFAVLYTLGNICSLFSTAFLWGPCNQLKDMFKPIRAGATIIYLLSMGFTLFAAFYLKLTIVVILSMIIQFCAMVWYCASYIPYGREMLKKCLGQCCISVVTTTN